MLNQQRGGRTYNHSRTFAIRDLEYEQEIAAERRKVAQHRRRQALLEARIEDYMKSYF